MQLPRRGEPARKLPSRDVPVGLMGISLAGWVIPLAAKLNPAVHFMIGGLDSAVLGEGERELAAAAPT